MMSIDTVPARPRTAWYPIFDDARARRALSIAADVTARLNDPNVLEASIAATLRQTAFPMMAHWQPGALAQGDAGLALLCSYADRCLPDDYATAAHRHLSAAAQAEERRPAYSDGIFSGLTGFAFAAWSSSRGGTRYRKLLTAIEETLLPRLRLRADALRGRSGMSVSEFDAISGAAGSVAYLAGRRDDVAAAATLDAVVSGLVTLLGDDHGAVPLWYTPADQLGDPSTTVQYPYGNLNCGLAHGLPGVLAALAIAARVGVRVDGLPAAIRAAATWLADHRVDDGWGINWPYAVPLRAPHADGRPAGEASRADWGTPSRSAWCYGPPGIARALWLAGDVLDDEELRTLAREAMRAVLRRPLAVRGIDSPTVCHGVSGLLAIVLRFAHETGDPSFIDAARVLGDQVLASYDPAAPLGYRDIEPGNNPVDRPGMLDGAPGVALVLLAAATAEEPVWDRLFLLS